MPLPPLLPRGLPESQIQELLENGAASAPLPAWLVGCLGDALSTARVGREQCYWMQAGDLLCSLLDRGELDTGVCSSCHLSIVHYPPIRSLPDPARPHHHQTSTLQHKDDMDIDLPPPPPPPAPLREAPHVDGTILTLAWAPKPVGLQVRRGNTGPWGKISGENGSNMMVMAGAVLPHATGGAGQAAIQRIMAFRLRANPRCVVNPLAFCRAITAAMPDLVSQARRLRVNVPAFEAAFAPRGRSLTLITSSKHV